MNKFNRIPKEKEKRRRLECKNEHISTNAPFQRNTTSRARKSTEEKKNSREKKKTTTQIALDTEHV